MTLEKSQIKLQWPAFNLKTVKSIWPFVSISEN